MKFVLTNKIYVDTDMYTFTHGDRDAHMQTEFRAKKAIQEASQQQ